MCKYSFEKISERTGKSMIYCKLQNENNGMKLCISQRFCKDKDKYIPHEQRNYCKFFE